VELPPGGPGEPPALPRRRRFPSGLISALSFLISLFTTTTLGAGWYLSTRTDVTTDLLPWLGPETIRRVWSDPQLLSTGLSFSLPLLLILLCHEFGHYLICRRYQVDASPPYFLPAPVGLGTFGAFIKIRAPIRDKRQLFDIGAGGPLAGFAALIPFLLYGVAKSSPAPLHLAPDPSQAPLVLFVPGKTLAIELATRLFHGPLDPATTLDLHPFALAAWVGLLATALNLLPLGQLDGGHILYAVVGPRQRQVAWPLWMALAAAGLIFWRGWLFWCLIVAIMGLRHPPVLNERQPLDRNRLRLAWLTLAIFVLSFMPVPISVIGVTE
jgi:membrane-associated protease RseP (regulator of RpoE activity)